ncbi:23S rRNA (adenine(1618)-N(6))-methyltransferase RlmF [Marinobacter caseinilyticus]|uniref:23S rRNA (adenine(1618)-N(6))-methyltransferase RlmF n=1 Tax=Marinobacter caseinilyticus TaxID=2692195 RepID=UPI00140D7A6A|nr:23S rRNA (adenine(1618)-N(6))-methyltransferase RlmF [Marinobacter caseinilyticus]
MTPAHKPKAKGLHPRNAHRERYDFTALINTSPELAPAVHRNRFDDLSINFADPTSVKLLNQALLKHFYRIRYWDIPDHYLCPPIPGRADYLHYLADLLASTPGNPRRGQVPTGKQIAALDVGMGANCVYPIIGSQVYGWRFVGSDIDPVAIAAANTLVGHNPALDGHLHGRLQTAPSCLFNRIIGDDEQFDVTLCNPPFHGSLAEAAAGSERKVKNLAASASRKGNRRKAPGKTPLNFGGQSAELWCPGGEAGFINRMVRESIGYARQCLWFSTLVSKKDNLPTLYKALEAASASDVKTITMAQGQKITRIVAWTFLSRQAQIAWCRDRWSE